jgi:hypothetical protein
VRDTRGGERDGGGAAAAAAARAPPPAATWRLRAAAWLSAQIRAINSRAVVFLAKRADIVALNKACLYVRDNELTSRVIVVHVVDDRAALRAARARAAARAAPGAAPGAAPAAAPGAAPAALALLAELPPPPADAAQLAANAALLDALYYPALRVDSLVVRGASFAPAAVAFLSRYLGVAPNLMFMAAPDHRFPHQFAALGGVRVITRSAPAPARRAAADRLHAAVATATAAGAAAAGAGAGVA